MFFNVVLFYSAKVHKILHIGKEKSRKYYFNLFFCFVPLETNA